MDRTIECKNRTKWPYGWTERVRKQLYSHCFLQNSSPFSEALLIVFCTGMRQRSDTAIISLVILSDLKLKSWAQAHNILVSVKPSLRDMLKIMPVKSCIFDQALEEINAKLKETGRRDNRTAQVGRGIIREYLSCNKRAVNILYNGDSHTD